MSTYTVTYNDTTKHNSTEILDTLRKNLSKVDFSGDIVGPSPWWEYISIGEPNEQGVFTLSVPGVSQDIDKIVRETLLRMEQISKVDDNVLSRCE